MIVYISGPISKNPSYMQDFGDAQRALEKAGHEVINPVHISQTIPWSIRGKAPLGSVNYCHILEIEKAYIATIAEAVYMLPGWPDSFGARKEKEFAEAHGILVLFHPDAEREEAWTESRY